jgi:hypothetical protein
MDEGSLGSFYCGEWRLVRRIHNLTQRDSDKSDL